MKTRKPAYLALYETLRDEILSGVRPFGSRLPSRRVLARDRGVSAITAEHSIELLCEEGYAESRAKSGYFVIYRESDAFSPPALSPAPRFSAPAAADSSPRPPAGRVPPAAGTVPLHRPTAGASRPHAGGGDQKRV